MNPKEPFVGEAPPLVSLPVLIRADQVWRTSLPMARLRLSLNPNRHHRPAQKVQQEGSVGCRLHHVLGDCKWVMKTRRQAPPLVQSLGLRQKSTFRLHPESLHDIGSRMNTEHPTPPLNLHKTKALPLPSLSNSNSKSRRLAHLVSHSPASHSAEAISTPRPTLPQPPAPASKPALVDTDSVPTSHHPQPMDPQQKAAGCHGRLSQSHLRRG